MKPFSPGAISYLPKIERTEANDYEEENVNSWAQGEGGRAGAIVAKLQILLRPPRMGRRPPPEALMGSYQQKGSLSGGLREHLCVSELVAKAVVGSAARAGGPDLKSSQQASSSEPHLRPSHSAVFRCTSKTLTDGLRAAPRRGRSVQVSVGER